MNFKILCYHGVITNKKKIGLLNYNGKHIIAQDFDKQMFFLKKNENVIALKDILNIKEKNNKTYSIITFDDGFKNNYKVAYKILKKYNLPATFFICPGIIDKKKLFWVDEIELCLNYTKKKSFCISINNRKKEFDISNLHKKTNVCEIIKKICKKEKNTNRKSIIKNLIKELNIVKLKKLKHLHDVLSWQDIKKMSATKLFDFGIHSYNHEIYSRLPSVEQNRNILKSKKKVYDKTGIKTYLASYPEGKKSDFNKKTIEYMIKNKIKICPMAVPGLNRLNTNNFYLKRYMVGFNNLKFPYRKFYEN